jgi:hypothetical protein
VTELLRRRNYKVISILEAEMELYLQNLKLMSGILWWSENHWTVIRQSQDKEWIFHDSTLDDILAITRGEIRQLLTWPPPEGKVRHGLKHRKFFKTKLYIYFFIYLQIRCSLFVELIHYSNCVGIFTFFHLS